MSLREICCALALCAGAFVSAQDGLSLSPVAFEEFFVEPGVHATIRFASSKNVPDDGLDYKLLSRSGKESGSGKLRKGGDGKTLMAELDLQRGFYELSVPSTGQRFGVVALEPFKGARDPFFSLETLIKRKPDAKAWMRLLKRMGVDCIREWESWENDERVEGKPDLKFEGFYKELADDGLKAVCCFGRMPAWTGTVNESSSKDFQPYPKYVLKTERSIVEMVRLRAPGLEAFQVGNEPDLRGQPGDGLMPIVVATNWFFAKNDIKTPLAGAAFGNASEGALKSYLKNGFLDYYDIFAFHTYSAPEDMIPRIALFRKAMNFHPKAAMPLWITESGKPWNRGLKRLSATYGGPNGNLRADLEEDKTSALWITMKAVEAKAGGVERYFPFTMRFFKENNNNFGMFDFNDSPMRSIAAYANCVRELAGKDYVGDLAVSPKGVKSARVFADAESAVAVLYTGSSLAGEVDVAGLPVLSAEAMDGSVLNPGSGGVLKFDGGMAYLKLDRSKTDPLLKRDTEAMRLFKQAKSYKPVPRKVSPAVFQFAHWNCKNKSQFSYGVEDGITANAINFSDEELELAPELSLPEGAKILEGPLQGGTLRLKALSSTPLSWKIDFSGCRGVEFPVTLRDAGGKAPDLFISLMELGKGVAKRLDVENPSRWRANSSGETTFSYDKEEKALKVHEDFSKTKKDFWTYPEFVFKSPEESLDGAVAISFEIKAKQGAGSPLFSHSLLMFAYEDVKEKGSSEKVKYSQPGPEWETRTVFFPDSASGKVKMIRLGMGPIDDSLDYWVRNVKIHYAK